MIATAAVFVIIAVGLSLAACGAVTLAYLFLGTDSISVRLPVVVAVRVVTVPVDLVRWMKVSGLAFLGLAIVAIPVVIAALVVT